MIVWISYENNEFEFDFAKELIQQILHIKYAPKLSQASKVLIKVLSPLTNWLVLVDKVASPTENWAISLLPISTVEFLQIIRISLSGWPSEDKKLGIKWVKSCDANAKYSDI